jgi:hypothetical protein
MDVHFNVVGVFSYCGHVLPINYTSVLNPAIGVINMYTFAHKESCTTYHVTINVRIRKITVIY